MANVFNDQINQFQSDIIRQGVSLLLINIFIHTCYLSLILFYVAGFIY